MFSLDDVNGGTGLDLDLAVVPDFRRLRLAAHLRTQLDGLAVRDLDVLEGVALDDRPLLSQLANNLLWQIGHNKFKYLSYASKSLHQNVIVMMLCQKVILCI